MLILAIDSGLNRTGFSLFEKNIKYAQGYRYIASGLIETQKKLTIEQRLGQIYKRVSQIIKKYKPDLIVIERLFFFKNQKTAISVSQAQGVILLLAYQHYLKVEFLTPLQIKQIITGYGQADKKAVQKMLELILKTDRPIKQDDEADAVACGLAYCFQNEKITK